MVYIGVQYLNFKELKILKIMRILVIILFCAIYTQLSAQGDEKVQIKDFNRDGVVDTLKTKYEGGSGFGGIFLELINGKTNEVHQATNFSSFGDIRYTVVLPPELDEIEDRPFIDIIKSELLPKNKKTPEGSLNWIIKGMQSNIELADNPFFDLIIDPQLRWEVGEIQLPSNYYIDIAGDFMVSLGNISNDHNQYDLGKDSQGFLCYNARNHYRSESGDSLDFSGGNHIFKVFHTSHGVVVKKGDLNKWVFVNDRSLTGGPEKLRWASVKSVQIYNQYLILHHLAESPVNNQFFIINIETGICGRLKFNMWNPSDEYIHRMQSPYVKERTGEIIFDSEAGEFTYILKDIFKELENQYIKE